jgi:phosphate transport system ATP-binding protein
VTAIIGPSGCGKSTMVRCINRMHEEIPGRVRRGQVKLDDLDIYAPVDVTAVRRLIGMVFQKPNPVPDDVDLRQRRRRAEADRHQGDNLRERVHRAVAAAVGSLGRGQGPAQLAGSGCPAVSSSGSASPARSPSSPR